MAQISKCSSLSAELNESSIISHHHGNLWDDDFIQSLKSSNGAPQYHERAAKLVEEIKNLVVSEMKDCNDDLIRRLQMVDIFECLGIDRHFQHEIQVALDYVYRYWNQLEGIGIGSRDSLIKDFNATALGFRALRLHRYNVSSDVLENFKNENGQFFCSSTVEEKEVRCMLTLFRASEISFPGEKVMDEAKAFTTEYLTKVLTGVDVTDVNQSLLREVKYALEFPWHCSLPRWEARSFIEICGQNDSWLKSIMNKRVLELAKLDFNILQWAHHRELQLLSSWWSQSDIAQQNFYRKRHVEFYLWVVIGTFEPEFSTCRITFAKISTLMTILDDLYDTHGTLEQLKIFTEGVKRWDLSLVDRLPDYIKITFEFFLNTSNELIAEVAKTQERDMSAYIRKTWERYLEAYLQEAEWIAARHVPTFDEYMKNGISSSGMCILNLYSLLLMGQLLPDDVLEQIHSPSKIHELVELTARLVDDSKDFETKKVGGELASGIECYVKDNPECTLEDASNHLNGLLDLTVKELNWEFVRHDSVALCFKKFAFNVARGLRLIYKYRDGFDVSNQEMKTHIFKILIDPLT
uniref:Longifolene synthase n=1 Tax=Picea abies TaxID=3329 RepID=TPSLS_PICAB|nr:RecName: Full=Longifolene synthase; Short=PaTPS-Lon [Picea abies]AAS47695.1 longifolene synthase [Picea abies]